MLFFFAPAGHELPCADGAGGAVILLILCVGLRRVTFVRTKVTKSRQGTPLEPRGIELRGLKSAANAAESAVARNRMLQNITLHVGPRAVGAVWWSVLTHPLCLEQLAAETSVRTWPVRGKNLSVLQAGTSERVGI